VIARALAVIALLGWSSIASARTVVVSSERLADAAARRVIEIGQKAIAEHGSFHLVLSGGSTPKALHQRLASLRGRLDWRKVQIFFGDERSVAPTDAASNYRMAKETLLDHVPIPARNVHRIRGEWLPTKAARSYGKLIAGRRLDLVLLGMGGDGHTASLFPGTKLGGEAVVATESPIAPTARVSMGLTSLNRAANVLFLVSGAEKAERVAEVLGGKSKLPAAQVKPSGKLTWLLDQQAANHLP
jgi:6-phosphogluconolactonase